MKVDDFDQLPPELRFFSGGDRSIRGFGFEEIGSRNAAGDVIGGDHLVEAQPSSSSTTGARISARRCSSTPATRFWATTSRLHVGAGAGIRWKSPVGVLRLDLAYPVKSIDSSGVADPLQHRAGLLKKPLRIAGISLAALLVLAAALLAWALHTESGTRALLALARALAPAGRDHRRGARHRRRHAARHDFRYRDPARRHGSARSRPPSCEVAPLALFARRLHVRRAQVDGVSLALFPAAPPPPGATSPPELVAVRDPWVAPLDMLVDDLQLARGELRACDCSAGPGTARASCGQLDRRRTSSHANSMFARPGRTGQPGAARRCARSENSTAQRQIPLARRRAPVGRHRRSRK